MATDREAARRRVKTITGWAAAGAAALTAGFAFGASKDSAATTKAAAPAAATQPSQGDSYGADQGLAPPGQDQGTVQPDQGGSGFGPPAASSGPPDATSGGS